MYKRSGSYLNRELPLQEIGTTPDVADVGEDACTVYI